MAKAVFAGSFDPFTRGHLEVLAHATNLFDEVYIVLAHNPAKQRTFDADKMMMALYQIVDTYPWLNKCAVAMLPENMALVDFAKKIGATYLVRGVRSTEDYSYEEKMRAINRHLNFTVNTIYIPTDSDISSTMVRTCKQLGHRWSSLVPSEVYEVFCDD